MLRGRGALNQVKISRVIISARLVFISVSQRVIDPAAVSNNNIVALSGDDGLYNIHIVSSAQKNIVASTGRDGIAAPNAVSRCHNLPDGQRQTRKLRTINRCRCNLAAVSKNQVIPVVHRNNIASRPTNHQIGPVTGRYGIRSTYARDRTPDPVDISEVPIIDYIIYNPIVTQHNVVTCRGINKILTASTQDHIRPIRCKYIVITSKGWIASLNPGHEAHTGSCIEECKPIIPHDYIITAVNTDGHRIACRIQFHVYKVCSHTTKNHIISIGRVNIIITADPRIAGGNVIQHTATAAGIKCR